VTNESLIITSVLLLRGEMTRTSFSASHTHINEVTTAIQLEVGMSSLRRKPIILLNPLTHRHTLILQTVEMNANRHNMKRNYHQMESLDKALVIDDDSRGCRKPRPFTDLKTGDRKSFRLDMS